MRLSPIISSTSLQAFVPAVILIVDRANYLGDCVCVRVRVCVFVCLFVCLSLCVRARVCVRAYTAVSVATNGSFSS